MSSAQPRDWKYWKRCEIEGRSAEWGIAFQRNDAVPHGEALVAGDAWAACIIVSHSTAEQLGRQDSAALWTALSFARPGEPALVGLPAFGGDAGNPRALPSGLNHLGEEAKKLAASYTPPPPKFDEDDDDHDDGDDDYDEDEDEDEGFWPEEETHYRWFMKERAPGVRWLNGLRPALVRELVVCSAANADVSPQSTIKVTRYGNRTILKNDAGGRLGTIDGAYRLRPGQTVRDCDEPENLHVHVLVLASERDRPAAVAACAEVAIEVAFDPTPGWLDATVKPAQHGWLAITWWGAVRGVRVGLELANFHIYKQKLTVFAAELCDPITILLHRNGFQVKEVEVTAHPDDPEALFGVDLDDLTDLMEQPTDDSPWIDGVRHGAAARPQPLQDPNSFESRRCRDRRLKSRKLRSAARSLLPELWAEQIEVAWNPNAAARESGADGTETVIDRIAPATGFRQISCRLCDGIVVQRIPDEYPYCHDCREDAGEGLFYDRGFDEPWVEAAKWALKTLAEIEFGGPPAKEQLAVLPLGGPNSDILMLSRMLTARWYETTLGSDRKAYAWTDWLAQAGLLTDGVRTSRGIVVTAKDGHLCRSLLERQIDDFFYDHGIAHEAEPHYPFDAEHNLNGYRADWRLSDGTFVEALGFPNKPEYMAKVAHKLAHADRCGIPVITVTVEDLPSLKVIFHNWLPPEHERPDRGDLPPRPTISPKKAKDPLAKNGRNTANISARQERLERCGSAVELQKVGLTIKEIVGRLGMSELSVKSLLRDGKFYADPGSDPDRLEKAKAAAAAMDRGSTRAQFRESEGLTVLKADECWRDADVLFG